MTLDDFMRTAGSWLLQEEVHDVLVYLLALCTLVLLIYLVISHHLMLGRLTHVELRHGQLIDKLVDVSGNIKTMRRVTQDHFDKEEIKRVQDEFDAAAIEDSSWEVDTRLRKLEDDEE